MRQHHVLLTAEDAGIDYFRLINFTSTHDYQTMIPGFIITWLTFPGVFVHELAHKIFCQITDTKIIKVCYFRFGNPAGYVIHDHPSSAWKNILIGIGPLIVNTLVGFGLALSFLPLREAGKAMENLYFGLMWLAVSIAMHSFPSTGDANSIWQGIRKQPSSILTKLIGYPVVAIIYAGPIGSIIWLDLLYGIGICVGIPELLHLR